MSKVVVAVVDFCEKAKEYCCFSEITLRVFLKNEEGKIVDTLSYNEYVLEDLRKKGIPIIYRMDTTSCRKIPKKAFMFERLFAGEILG